MALVCLACACSRKSTKPSGEPGTVAQAVGSDNNASLPANAPGAASTAVAIPVVTPACKPGTADVAVTVDTSKGPLGASAVPFTSKLLSQNIDDKVPAGYSPTLDPNYVAYLKALKPAMLRWPSGYNSQTYQFSTTQSGNNILTPAFIQSFLALCTAVGAEPLFGINVDPTTGASAENAAELVTYLNKTLGAKVTWFHIGNEPDLDPNASTPAAYAATFATYRQAMLMADPTIKLVGGELVTGARVIGTAGQPNWLAPILAQTQSTPMDAIDWHYYPKDSSQQLTTSSAYPTPANLLLETAPDWPPAGLDFASIAFPLIKQARSAMAPNAELWVDEFAEDSGQANGVGLADRAVGALWVADALGRFAEQGADSVFRFIFKTSPDHGYDLVDPNFVLRPDYYAYWLYANTFGDSLISATSSAQDQVAVHAATRTSDGSLRVMLVNKSTVAKTVSTTLAGFTPKASGRYQLVASAYLDAAMTLNGTSLTAASVVNGEAAVAIAGTADACPSTVLTLPPVSVTVMAYAPAAK